MSEIVPASPDIYDPAPNPAIARCYQAYRQAAKTAREQGKYDFEIRSAAREAYRSAMPPLSGAENIRDFIACIAEGMLNESISGNDATRLLYAAQVAGGVLAKVDKLTPGKPGRPLINPVTE
jgi:hypothetical protein